MVKFPQSLDDNESLFLAVNNLRTQLTIDLTDTDTTATVVTTSGFPPTGYISILTGTNILDTEAITYSGTTSTEFLNLGRGADNTEALPHEVGDNVDLTIVAQHHNELKDAIIVLEEFVGISGATNFVPKDEFGNVTITGTLDVSGDVGMSGSLLVLENTTISGALDAGYVAVTGTLAVCGSADFKEDVVVSGCIYVGDIPDSATPDMAYSLLEEDFNTSSTSYVDVTGTETGPLAVGNNLLFFGASAGSTVGSPSANLRCQFAGSTVGESEDRHIVANGAWNGTNLSGWKMVSGNGVSTAIIQADLDTGGSGQDVSAASIMAIPLDDMGLVENTDYWYDNGSDSTTTISTGDGQVTINSLVTSSLTAGDYILFGYMESGATNNTSVTESRFYMDGVAYSSNWSRLQNLGGTTLRSTAFVRKVTLSEGVHTFEARGQVFFLSSGQFRRANLAIVRADAFDQVEGLRSGTNTAVSNDTFTKVSASEITYTPNQEETIVVFANPDAFTGTNQVSPSYKLVNETDGIDYMVDASNLHHSTSNESHGLLLFTKLDNVYTPHTFSLSVREPDNTGSTVTHNTVNMVVWGLSTNVTSSTQFTRICGDKIQTPDLCADTITVINDGTVTVSGEPVLINVPDDIDINSITVNDLTVEGDTLLNTLTVTGTQVHFDVDFVGISGTTEHKGDICVWDPYTIKVGKTEAVEVQIEADEDITETLQSNSVWTSVNIGDEVIPAAGVETMILYAVSMGGADLNVEPSAQVLWDGDQIAFAHRINGSPSGQRSGTAFQLAGFTVVTGTQDNAAFDVQVMANSSTFINYSTPRVIAWPLSDRFEKDYDYFFDVVNDSGFVVTNAPTSFDNGASNEAMSVTYNLPEDGNYLFFACVEGDEPAAAFAAGRAMRCRFAVDGTYQKTEYMQRTGLPGPQSHDASFFTVNRVNLTAGEHTFTVEVASRTDATSDWRRPRIMVFRENAVSQVVRDRRTTDLLLTSTSYANTGLDITYTPTQDEDVLIIMTAVPSRLNGNIHSSSRLNNVTTGEYYVADKDDDAGTGANGGAYGSTDRDNTTFNLIHTLPFVDGEAQRVRWQANCQPVAFGQPCRWGFSTISGADTPSDMFMISMTPAPTDEFECVTITGSEIYAHKITVDDVCISGSATISGAPVSTGTHTTINGIVGDITLVDAGSVVITQDGQIITISGSASGGGGGGSAYTHTQASAASTWNISHGLGTEVIHYITYDTSDEQIYPDTFTVVDSNNVTITWVAPQAGTAYIFGDSAATSIGDLQFAYDAGDGSIVTVSGKPVLISGTENDEDVDFKVVGSGVFTEALTIGEGSTAIDDHSITTGSGIFTDSLTVSGIPVAVGAGVSDPLNIGTVNASTSLTISGVPVSTGTGGGAGTITDINVTATGPSVTVTGAGGIDTITEGNIITISGGQFSPGFRGAIVYKDTNQSISHDTQTPVEWDRVKFDTDGWFDSGSNTIFTVPQGVNRVRIGYNIRWDANATGLRQYIVQVNSAASATAGLISHNVEASQLAGVPTDHSGFTAPISVNAGDTIRLLVQQESTISLDVEVVNEGDNWFSVEVIDPLPAPGPNLTGKQQFRGVLLTTSSGISFENNTVLEHPWDVIRYDTEGFVGSDVSRIEIPEGVTRIRAHAAVLWDDDDATADGTERLLQIVEYDALDGAAVRAVSFSQAPGVNSGASEPTGQITSTPVFSTSPGKAYGVRGRQLSGVTISTIPSTTSLYNHFAIEVIEDNEPITFNEFVAVSGTFTEVVAATGTFTEGITVGSSTIDIQPNKITSPAGEFTSSLTVSGTPVMTFNSFVGAALTTSSGLDDVGSTAEFHWDTVQYDTGGLVNLATDNKAFIIPAEHENAFWVAKAQAFWDDTNPGDRRVWTIVGPPGPQARDQDVSADAEDMTLIAITPPFQAPAGTRIRVTYFAAGPLSTVLSSSNRTWFSIERVGVSGTV